MILDLGRFTRTARPLWRELESRLDALERAPEASLDPEAAYRLYYLYQRASADLVEVSHLPAESKLRAYLESLVGRAYAEIHGRSHEKRFAPGNWLTRTFPRTVRRHAAALALSAAITILGCAFGVIALRIDPEAKEVIMPFSHLQQTPKQRVAEERKRQGSELQGRMGRFSGELMTHNTRVSFTVLSLGITYGIGTGLMLFYNGVILGAVSYDYTTGGEGVFLLGWLLPHGSVEIPAIVLAGQAGFVLAGALIGWRGRQNRAARFRLVAPDLATLAGGVALLLVWAGVIEAFFSQYHEPVLPYAIKIAFGTLQLGLLVFYLARQGAQGPRD
jgi:uncharacterized membrane protein SpoIIM required for sporulation